MAATDPNPVYNANHSTKSSLPSFGAPGLSTVQQQPSSLPFTVAPSTTNSARPFPHSPSHPRPTSSQYVQLVASAPPVSPQAVVHLQSASRSFTPPSNKQSSASSLSKSIPAHHFIQQPSTSQTCPAPLQHSQPKSRAQISLESQPQYQTEHGEDLKRKSRNASISVAERDNDSEFGPEFKPEFELKSEPQPLSPMKSQTQYRQQPQPPPKKRTSTQKLSEHRTPSGKDCALHTQIQSDVQAQIHLPLHSHQHIQLHENSPSYPQSQIQSQSQHQAHQPISGSDDAPGHNKHNRLTPHSRLDAPINRHSQAKTDAEACPQRRLDHDTHHTAIHTPGDTSPAPSLYSPSMAVLIRVPQVSTEATGSHVVSQETPPDEIEVPQTETEPVIQKDIPRTSSRAFQSAVDQTSFEDASAKNEPELSLPSTPSKPLAIVARGESISLARRAAATAKRRREEARAQLERQGVHSGVDSALAQIVESSAATRANVSQNKAKRSKRVKWSEAEVEALCKGVMKYGRGRWAVILREFASDFHKVRISVDLKDKWRNLSKAQRAGEISGSFFAGNNVKSDPSDDVHDSQGGLHGSAENVTSCENSVENDVPHEPLAEPVLQAYDAASQAPQNATHKASSQAAGHLETLAEASHEEGENTNSRYRQASMASLRVTADIHQYEARARYSKSQVQYEENENCATPIDRNNAVHVESGVEARRITEPSQSVQPYKHAHLYNREHKAQRAKRGNISSDAEAIEATHGHLEQGTDGNMRCGENENLDENIANEKHSYGDSSVHAQVAEYEGYSAEEAVAHVHSHTASHTHQSKFHHYRQEDHHDVNEGEDGYGVGQRQVSYSHHDPQTVGEVDSDDEQHAVHREGLSTYVQHEPVPNQGNETTHDRAYASAQKPAQERSSLHGSEHPHPTHVQQSTRKNKHINQLLHAVDAEAQQLQYKRHASPGYNNHNESRNYDIQFANQGTQNSSDTGRHTLARKIEDSPTLEDTHENVYVSESQANLENAPTEDVSSTQHHSYPYYSVTRGENRNVRYEDQHEPAHDVEPAHAMGQDESIKSRPFVEEDTVDQSSHVDDQYQDNEAYHSRNHVGVNEAVHVPIGDHEDMHQVSNYSDRNVTEGNDSSNRHAEQAYIHEHAVDHDYRYESKPPRTSDEGESQPLHELHAGSNSAHQKMGIHVPVSSEAQGYDYSQERSREADNDDVRYRAERHDDGTEEYVSVGGSRIDKNNTIQRDFVSQVEDDESKQADQTKDAGYGVEHENVGHERTEGNYEESNVHFGTEGYVLQSDDYGQNSLQGQSQSYNESPPHHDSAIQYEVEREDSQHEANVPNTVQHGHDGTCSMGGQGSSHLAALDDYSGGGEHVGYNESGSQAFGTNHHQVHDDERTVNYASQEHENGSDYHSDPHYASAHVTYMSESIGSDAHWRNQEVDSRSRFIERNTLEGEACKMDGEQFANLSRTEAGRSEPGDEKHDGSKCNYNVNSSSVENRRLRTEQRQFAQNGNSSDIDEDTCNRHTGFTNASRASNDSFENSEFAKSRNGENDSGGKMKLTAVLAIGSVKNDDGDEVDKYESDKRKGFGHGTDNNGIANESDDMKSVKRLRLENNSVTIGL